MAGTLESLAEEEALAVASVVDALVNRNKAALAAVGAYEDGAEPFMYVDTYYPDRAVDLVVPPGAPESWPGDVLRSDQRPGWAFVCIEMFDRVNGMTDLTLELDVFAEGGTIEVAFRGLHVM